MKKVENDIRIRCVNLGNYIKDKKCTIRSCAKHFNMAKSTVHIDVSRRLKYINFELYLEVKKQLNINFNNKHINGGKSTKIKYENLRYLNSCKHC